MQSKSISFLLTILSLTSLSGCQKRETLLLLNWGEYISDEVVSNFENEYNCDVKISIADSNELFYSKVKGGTTVYDLVVPSDYMVEKMVDHNLLQQLDYSLLSNYSRDSFLDSVNGLYDEMDSLGKEYSSYCVPYFYGTFGLMYSKRKPELEKLISDNSWEGYFNPEIISSSYKVGMYNVPRDVYAATMFYNHLSPNEINDELLSLSYDTLTKRDFTSWATDNLKKGIESGNLDLAFVYTGDFLDMAYEDCKTLDDVASLDYGIYVPDETIAFIDNLVMTKNARHKNLAYKFMDYLLEPKNAIKNASIVGYCTALKESYQSLTTVDDNSSEEEKVRAKLISTYYPIIEGEKKYQGTLLTYFSKDELTKLTNLVNNAKVN